MDKEEKTVIIDETNGAPQSDFTKGIDSFLNYQAKEVADDEGKKALFIASIDTHCSIINGSLMGKPSIVCHALVELMTSQDKIKDVILASAFAFLHVPDDIQKLLCLRQKMIDSKQQNFEKEKSTKAVKNSDAKPHENYLESINKFIESKEKELTDDYKNKGILVVAFDNTDHQLVQSISGDKIHLIGAISQAMQSSEDVKHAIIASASTYFNINRNK